MLWPVYFILKCLLECLVLWRRKFNCHLFENVVRQCRDRMQSKRSFKEAGTILLLPIFQSQFLR